MIPSLISMAQIHRFPEYLNYALIGVAFMAVLPNRVARPVNGLEIVTPALLPSLSTAIAAILLVYVRRSPP